MNNLRKLARDQQCCVRVPGVCNFDNRTTVLAHLPGAGTGRKAADIFGAHCCSSCHDVIDGRVKSWYTHNELKLMHHEGVQRTQQWLLDNGFITVP